MPPSSILVRNNEIIVDPSSTEITSYRIFAIGTPSFDNKPLSRKGIGCQGSINKEQSMLQRVSLLEEKERYGDPLVTPNRDHYIDSTEKLLGVLRYGVEHDCDCIIK